MATAGTDSDIDWMAYELIETVPGKVSGLPIGFPYAAELLGGLGWREEW